MSRPRINDFTVTGNLDTDPHIRDHEDGSMTVILTVAENRRFFNEETAAWEDTAPVYYQVGLSTRDRSLGNLPQNAAASLKKGDMVSVKGNYEAAPYTNKKTGELGINHRIWATDVAPSLKFATVEITRNEPSQSAAAEMVAEAEARLDPSVGAAYREQVRERRLAREAGAEQGQTQPEFQQPATTLTEPPLQAPAGGFAGAAPMGGPGM